MTDPLLRPVAPPFLAAFMAMHGAMRRDLAVMPHAVERSVAGNDVDALAHWFGLVRATIEHHHHLEDDQLWPELERRLPGFLAGINDLVADHHRLDEAMERVTAALDALAATIEVETVDEAKHAAQYLGELLVDHLDSEERAVLGPIATAFTAQEYEQFEAGAAKGTPLRLFAFGLPWLLDGVDTETRRNVLAPMPALARLLYHPFCWYYRRMAAPVRDL